VSETVTFAPSDSIHGTKISRHLSGSWPIHPPQVYNTFFPIRGDAVANDDVRLNIAGESIAAAAATALFDRNSLLVTIGFRF
jgi:hypothetical protein